MIPLDGGRQWVEKIVRGQLCVHCLAVWLDEREEYVAARDLDFVYSMIHRRRKPTSAQVQKLVVIAGGALALMALEAAVKEANATLPAKDIRPSHDTAPANRTVH